MIGNYLLLFYTFLKISIVGFGGGYAMMSMIMVECEKLSITPQQFADLNALDMVVPGPIAINAATYVGYLHSGVLGSVAATLGSALPSLFLVTLTMYFIKRFQQSRIKEGIMSGVKPAAVGLIAAAALMIASGVLVREGADMSTLFADPFGTISLLMVGIFAVTAGANIVYKINPILLTLIAGVIGAIFAQ